MVEVSHEQRHCHAYSSARNVIPRLQSSQCERDGPTSEISINEKGYLDGAYVTPRCPCYHDSVIFLATKFLFDAKIAHLLQTRLSFRSDHACPDCQITFIWADVLYVHIVCYKVVDISKLQSNSR